MRTLNPNLIKSVRDMLPENVQGNLPYVYKVAEEIYDTVNRPVSTEYLSPEVANIVKGIVPDMGGITDAMTQIRAALAELGKEVAFTPAIPTSLGLQIFDLAGPARQLYPVLSPSQFARAA